jgi:predicted nucleic acid-binding protein
MTYCDTSFLLALYIEAESFHALARRAASSFSEPVPLTFLGELELENGIRRSLRARTITLKEHDAIIRQLAEDVSDGFFVRKSPQQPDHFTAARSLSRKFTPQLSCRSLDILHVAAAQLLRARAFASFDLKQRRLAEEVGLESLPGRFSGKPA